ncbi:MAG: substrate-binding periplasmic protein [Syntrophobacteraceae bacterium]
MLRAATLISITAAVGCLLSFPAPSHARSLEEIKASGEFRACIAPLTPAYAAQQDASCRTDCAFSGPIPDEMEAFVKWLGGGIRPVMNRVEWDEQFHNDFGQTDRDGSYTPWLLASGRCDAYPTHVTQTAWRVKKLDFAVLFKSRMMVLAPEKLKDVLKSPEDLQGRTAAVEKNTSYHTWLQEQNATTFAKNPVVIKLMNMEDGLRAVESGEVDFSLVDADIALWKVANTLHHVVVAFPVGPVDSIGWAFRKEDRDLREAVQQFFDAQKEDDASELNRIWKKAFGVTMTQLNTLIDATK